MPLHWMFDIWILFTNHSQGLPNVNTWSKLDLKWDIEYPSLIGLTNEKERKTYILTSSKTKIGSWEYTSLLFN